MVKVLSVLLRLTTPVMLVLQQLQLQLLFQQRGKRKLLWTTTATLLDNKKYRSFVYKAHLLLSHELCLLYTENSQREREGGHKRQLKQSQKFLIRLQT